jgi:hypothetical protein
MAASGALRRPLVPFKHLLDQLYGDDDGNSEGFYSVLCEHLWPALCYEWQRLCPDRGTHKKVTASDLLCWLRSQDATITNSTELSHFTWWARLLISRFDLAMSNK